MAILAYNNPKKNPSMLSKKDVRDAKKFEREQKKQIKRDFVQENYPGRMKAADFFSDLGTTSMESMKQVARGEIPLIGKAVKNIPLLNQVAPEVPQKIYDKNRSNTLGENILYTADQAARTGNNAAIDAGIGILGGKAIGRLVKKVEPKISLLKKQPAKVTKSETTPADIGLDRFRAKLDGLNDIRSAKLNATKAGSKYMDELRTPEMQKRLRVFDSEYGTRFLDRVNTYGKLYDNSVNIGGSDLINIVNEPDVKWTGLNSLDESGILRKHAQETGIIPKHPKESIFIDDRKSTINLAGVGGKSKHSLESVTKHELMHGLNSSNEFLNESPKLIEDIKGIYKNYDESLNEFKSAHDMKRAIFGGDEINIDQLTKFREDYDYITKPTETWSFLMTNLRDELLDAGVLKSRTGAITVDQLNKAGTPTWNRFKRYIKPEEFVKLFNKGFGAVAGLGTINQLQDGNK